MGRKILLVLAIVICLALIAAPLTEQARRRVGTGETLLDILALNGAVVGTSLLSSGYTSGVGLELRQHGRLGRGAAEFARFWDYEYTIPSEKMVWKKKNLLLTHPLMGYEYTNFLLAKGYSKKRALITTALGVYLLEKGIQGSFETPSAYDLLSYFSGAVISVAVHEGVASLYHSHPALRPLAIALNPFLLVAE
jgi:hypothetical protein